MSGRTVYDVCPLAVAIARSLADWAEIVAPSCNCLSIATPPISVVAKCMRAAWTTCFHHRWRATTRHVSFVRKGLSNSLASRKEIPELPASKARRTASLTRQYLPSSVCACGSLRLPARGHRRLSPRSNSSTVAAAPQAASTDHASPRAWRSSANHLADNARDRLPDVPGHLVPHLDPAHLDIHPAARPPNTSQAPRALVLPHTDKQCVRRLRSRLVHLFELGAAELGHERLEHTDDAMQPSSATGHIRSHRALTYDNKRAQIDG